MLACQCPQIKLRNTVLSNVFLAWNMMSQMNWKIVLFHQSDLTYCLEILLLSWLVFQRFLKWTMLFKLCSNKQKVFSSYLITKMPQIKLKMQLLNTAQKFYLWKFGTMYTITSFDLNTILLWQSVGAEYSQRYALLKETGSAWVSSIQ